MPRKNFVPSSEFPYHVTARCINKEWFKIPLEEVWSLLSDYLHFIHHAFGVRIHNFVLMDNHFHLIVSTPQANLPAAMNYFMRETSRIISRRSFRINQVYGGPYHWCLMTSPAYYLHAYKYVYRNPVEANLCSAVQDYRYSTLRGLVGFEKLVIPVCNDETLFNDLEGQIAWLNESYKNADEKESVRKALRKRDFKFPKRNGVPFDGRE